MGEKRSLGAVVDSDHTPLQRFGAELFGTLLLVFVSAGAGVVEAATGEPISLGAKAAARGLIVMVLIYTLGGVSGAHLNPAVTFAFALRGAFPWARAAAYWVAQLLGGLGGAALLLALFGHALAAGTTTPGPGVSAGIALVTEIVLALLLVSVILGTAEEAHLVGPNAAIAVGATIGLCACFADPVSGASMNAFRSFAPALLSGQLDHVWIYFVASFAGALGAVALAFFFHGPPNRAELKAGRGSM